MKTRQETRDFFALLASKGYKCTFERKLILSKVLKSDSHFDADQLCDDLRKEGHRISRDTVYRTLPLLLESGVLQKSVGEGKREYFERTGPDGHHDHMICLSCSAVIEFHSSALERLQDAVCRDHGFQLSFHDHRLFGYCKRCGPRTGRGGGPE